ncbi:MAG: SDR family NAD(P)-dependent oxidoreductase [Flavitalea sp.]
MTNAYTAIVTGASDGLGKSFALELASRKFNLVLISLKNAGLPQLGNYIRKNFDIGVTIIECDLTDSASCATIFQVLSSKQIVANILINNAGIGNFSLLGDKDGQFYQYQITLNTIIPVLMTRLFLKQVDVNDKQYILNVGSLGSRYLVPRKQVYGATKSFIEYFTRSMQLELSGSNVSVSLLSPGGINTKPELLLLNQQLKGIARASITEANKVAREGINGMLERKKEIIPGNINKIMAAVSAFIPQYFQNAILRRKLNTA